MPAGFFACVVFSQLLCSEGAAWPTARGSVAREGYVDVTLKPPFYLRWVCSFARGRLSTAMEPIVAGGYVYACTHSGDLYAVHAVTGKAAWRFHGHSPFIANPGYEAGVVVAADTGGYLFALSARQGKLLWAERLAPGGCAAAPTVAGGRIYLGARCGTFFCLDLKTGKVLWKHSLGAPIRQTASCDQRRVYVTAEDLRLFAFECKSGKLLWHSEPLFGQSARDYYPVVARCRGRTYVIVRTSPLDQMSRRIALDRHFLCTQAGIDDSSWKKVKKWTESTEARGNPHLWEKEGRAICRYLKEHPEARTFYLFEADSGRRLPPPPVLWCGGCQGVGTPPVVFPGGRLFVMYRSAYGNWNRGVAPLVALGILDIQKNRIRPLFHRHGMRPPWNTFWGTADESQNFLLAGSTVLIVHQGTLSAFDMKRGELFLIAGNRDTWGGLPNLPHARNEWHGPARAGVALVGDRLYWQTGSRLVCIQAGGGAGAAAQRSVDGRSVPALKAPPAARPSPAGLRALLEEAVGELLERTWAPLWIEPGLAGREFFFDSTAELCEALAWAYPHVGRKTQARIDRFLQKLWTEKPPWSASSLLGVKEGARREYHRVQPRLLERQEAFSKEMGFAGVYPLWLYAERCHRWDRVLEVFPHLKDLFDAFTRSRWTLDPKEGDIRANRFAASLIAFSAVAERAGAREYSRAAASRAQLHVENIARWWQEVASHDQLPVFHNIRQWDGFRTKRGFLFLRLRPHRAKLALFSGLSPALAAALCAEKVPVNSLWESFTKLCPTWHLAGEERQVHYGENAFDPPDLSLAAFQAFAFLKHAPFGELARRVDIPFCRADLTFITKLGVALDAVTRNK